MLTVMEAIQQRRSIRRYKPDPVPEEALLAMLEAARLAPSGSNSQPWRFIVVADPEERKKLREHGCRQRWLEEAPVVIVCCADLNAYHWETRTVRRDELTLAGIREDQDGSTIWDRISATIAEQRDPRLYIHSAFENSAIAIEHMVLVAASLGLGTCWTGGFDVEPLREMFGLPDNLIIVALLSVGYPAQAPAPRPRLKLEQILLRPLPEMPKIPVIKQG